MTSLKITIRSRENKKNELLGTCRLVNERTRLEKGCSGCEVALDADDGNVVVLEQQWEKESFLMEYFRSDHFGALLGAMKWLGRTYEILIDGGPYKEKESKP